MDYNIKWDNLNARLRSFEGAAGDITVALAELELDQRQTGFIKDDLKEVRRLICQNSMNPELTFRVQVNPKRSRRHVGAGIGKPPPGEKVLNNGCFLCRENIRWQQRQQQIGFQISTNSNAYNVWMNPFPLMPNHVVIAACEHVPQAWSNCKDTQGNMSLRQILSDFGETAQRLPGHVGFYNGVNAGASIPGHLHFQFFSRLSGHPVFPLEQCKFSDPTSAGEPRFSLGYPVPVALWRGPANDVISNAVDWIADWEERNTHRRDSLSCNMIVASEDGGRTIALYFVPRISKRQWWNGDKGIVGGVELLGELVMASHEECAMVENGEVDYAFIESALGAVYTPFETN